MSKEVFYLLFLGIPFVCLTAMYVILVFANRQTTGEIKVILPPDILLKVFAVFMLLTVVFILGSTKILNESTVSALLGAVVSGTLGIVVSPKS